MFHHATPAAGVENQIVARGVNAPSELVDEWDFWSQSLGCMVDAGAEHPSAHAL